MSTSLSPVPMQSSTIALSLDNTRLVNVNSDVHTVTVFNAAVNPPTKIAEIPAGVEPTSVAINPSAPKAYVTDSYSGLLYVIDLNALTVTNTIAVGVEPMGVAVSPNGTRAYVANSISNTVTVIDTASETPILTIDVSAFGSAPRAIAVTNNGDTNDTDETVLVAMFFSQLRPGKIALDEGQDDQREGRIVSIAAATNAINGAAVVSPIANTGFNSNGKLAPAVGTTPAIASTNPQAFTIPTGAFPNQLASIAVQPNTTRAYVVSTAASPNGPFRFNVMAQGLVSVFDVPSRAEITSAQTGAAVRQTAPLNLNQGINLATTPAPRLFNTNPVAISWRPNGSDAWVVIQNSDVILRLTTDGNGVPTINAPLVAGPSTIVRADLENVAPADIAGKAPRGIVIDSTGTRAYISNFVSRSVTVVDISNPTLPAITGTVASAAQPTPGTEEANIQLGEELFYTGRGPQGRMASESWGSCATCHPQGRSDNVTWMFDSGPRQTIALDQTFAGGSQRILNWSAVRDEVHDFELNTRNVFGGRGLIDDDRLFYAIAGLPTAAGADTGLVEQFQQVTGAVGTTNDLNSNSPIPSLAFARRDFGIATSDDGRIFIIGGRSGVGQGVLVPAASSVVEFNPRTNAMIAHSGTGFTPRHSLGCAAVTTNQGLRIYAIGGYASISASASPVSTVEEFNPATDTWRTVASLPTAVAQFGVTVAGGINTAEPVQLIHVVSGNTGTESAPSVTNANPVQRFQPDPAGPGTWSAFVVAGLTLRRNHGAATVLRGVQSRVFVIGGQDASGTVLDTVDEYQAQAVVIPAGTRTNLPSARARFGIGASRSTNQIYVVGGVDSAGADQATIFEYTVANQGAVAGPAGSPSGAWVTRGNLSVARHGLQLNTPPGVTNLLTIASSGRDSRQDAISLFVARRIRSTRAAISPNDPNAVAGKSLTQQVGLVVPGFSCTTCHQSPRYTASTLDYSTPPSPEVGLSLGNERVIGAEIRQTATQSPAFPGSGLFPGVLVNVGTFSAAGRPNEIRTNAADIAQAIAPLGANGFNIPSFLSISETAPYFYSGLATTLSQVLDGSQDSNGGTRQHFVTDPAQRAQLVAYLQSIESADAEPTVAAHPVSYAVCAGASASFSVFGVGTPAPSIQWQVSTDGGGTFTDIIGQTSTSIGFSTSPALNGNLYRAVLTNRVGVAVSNAAMLTVNTSPSVTSGPVSRTVDVGAHVTFSASASGNPTMNVKWQVSANGGGTFTDIPGANATSYTRIASASDNGLVFQAIFTTNNCSPAFTGSATLTVRQFTDPTLLQGITVVRAAHILELRTKIDEQRARWGLGGFGWNDPGLTLQTSVRGVHIMDLREALRQAYVAAGRSPVPSYTDPVTTGGTVRVKAIHILQIRQALVDLE